MTSSHLLQSAVITVFLAFLLHSWLQIGPRANWQPSDNTNFPSCADHKSPFIVFGGSSMLGKYIVESFQELDEVCIINYGRSECKLCDINIKGDLRDSRHVARMVLSYKPETILTAVKPPLLGIHYKTYLELNLFSMMELTRIAKSSGVQNFIYVSSIAAAGHYHWHHNSDANEKQPLYTDYEAAYDVSKRVAEDYLLSMHEKDRFNTISIRIGGVLGGKGDAYDYLRYPILFGFEPEPPLIDSNYAGNIADALVVVYKTMKVNQSVTGRFYYYTGEPTSETEKIKVIAEKQNKPLVILPLWLLQTVKDVWHYVRWDPDVYTQVDLIRMALIEQTFDQTLFLETFQFNPKYSMNSTLQLLYGN